MAKYGPPFFLLRIVKEMLSVYVLKLNISYNLSAKNNIKKATSFFQSIILFKVFDHVNENAAIFYLTNILQGCN